MNKVWAYVISKELQPEQLQMLKKAGEDFVKEWTAHEQKLLADFSIFKDRILVISVNEEVHAASGCSIDKLLRFIKQQEQLLSIELLNRMLVAYEMDQGLVVTPASRIPELLALGQMKADTIVYDTAVSDSEQLSAWRKSMADTWLKKYLAA